MRAAIAWIGRNIEPLPAVGRIRAVEGTRALAAMLVFLFHFQDQQMLRPAQGVIGTPVSLLWQALGPLGTNCFLVISGCFVYRSLTQSSVSWSEFYRRRVFRLYPFYLIVLSVYLILSFCYPQASRLPANPADVAECVIANVVLLAGILPIRPIISQSWTLNYIFAFYLVSPWLVRYTRFYRLPKPHRMAILAGFTAACGLGLGALGSNLVRIQFLFIGILVWETTEWFTRLPRQPAWLPRTLLASAAVALAGYVLLVFHAPRAMGIRLLAALFLFCFCFCAFGGHPGLSRLLARRPIRLFGGLSYSFYLTHGLTLNFLNHVAAPRLFGGAAPSPLAWLWYPASITAATVVAAGFFLLFERHFIRRRVTTQVAFLQEDFPAGMTCAAGNQRAACRAAAAATRC